MSGKRLQRSLESHAHHLEKEFWVSISDLFQDKWWRAQKKQEIDKFWACFFLMLLTLFHLKWLLAAHFGLLSPLRCIPLNPWAPEGEIDLLVNLLRWQWAQNWGHCGLCVTQQQCPEPLKVQEASACPQCSCYISTLYLIYKQFIMPLLSLGASWIVSCD